MDKPITKESIDKKLGFDFTTYSSGISIETESDIPHENPCKDLTDEELDFILNYEIERMRKMKKRNELKKLSILDDLAEKAGGFVENNPNENIDMGKIREYVKKTNKKYSDLTEEELRMFKK
ncbi:hypothetical protein SAMN05421767_13614 [Granulicatella balaenopterae]|uniref:Uncharacterized protein n=1 Tax=Granulicatella balaenopterae TaxID=137733 RepID=A0A1H9N7W9_9LACT|nr:hypothetical protein [Granulicatella balaenopterae]SER32130.1 hypothetical protein SAMN05421767_13614 [Granulicatella balaenopterae]